MTGTFAPDRCFEHRPVVFRGVGNHNAWRIKRYEISFPGDRFDDARFEPARRTALDALPMPAITTHRPGIAIMIAHQGRAADYLVLCWWDRDNELPIRIWVRADGRDGGRWTPAHESESVCVWDLGVLWFEREAFVRTMLGDAGPDGDAYLRAACPSTA